jgi:protein-S-isoprenylcysteine O-methyltransferase Ste14
LSNALAFLFLPAYVLYIHRFQIAPEERALKSLFGETYVAYQTRARRWL